MNEEQMNELIKEYGAENAAIKMAAYYGFENLDFYVVKGVAHFCNETVNVGDDA